MIVKSTVYGVDFSGAKDACHRIWITRGTVTGGILSVDRCLCLADWIGLERADRDRCLGALRDIIAGDQKAVFGLDLSFAIPGPLMGEKDWEGFVLDFPHRYGGPEHFRSACRRATRNREIKRHTECENRAPFSVYNLRIFKQTYFGIRDVIHPLVRDQLACFLPMQPAQDDKPWVIEICPACRLKREGIYVPYKGSTEKELEARIQILEYFVGKGLLISSKVRDLVVGDIKGDALDSIIAAFATFRVLNEEGFAKDIPDIHMKEGHIFV